MVHFYHNSFDKFYALFDDKLPRIFGYAAGIKQNEQYKIQVETLTTENLAIQQEIHKIKSDERTIGNGSKKDRLESPE